jgi:O-antigen/teichoic acid export membrane protein
LFLQWLSKGKQVLRGLARSLDKIVPGVARSLGWETLLMAVSLPASIFMNRALGAELRGLLALTMLVPTMLFTIGSCQWDRVVRGLVTSRQASSQEAWRRTLAYAWKLSVVFIPAGVIVSVVYPGLPPLGRMLSALYCFNFPIYFLGGTLQAIFLAAGSVDEPYWSRLSMQGSYLLLLLGSVALGVTSVPLMIAINVVIHAISLGIVLLLRHNVLSGESERAPPSMMALFRALPPLVGEVVAAKSDLWALSMFGTLAGVGRYTGLSTLMLPVALVSNAMLSSSVARLDWTCGTAVRRYLVRSAAVLGVVCVCVAALGFAFGSQLLSAVLGKSFAAGEWMIPWIAAIVVGQAVATQFHTSVQLRGHATRFLTIQTAEAVARIALVMLLGGLDGERGVLIALVATALLKAIWSGYALRRD